MEIGKLEAVFTANTGGFDRGVRGVEAKVVGLSAVMKSLGSTSVALQGPLGGVAGRLQGLSALSSQASGSMGILGVGLAVVSAATVGLGVALFGLIKKTAEAGGELFDLSQKTGFAVETLSALSVLAQTTGSDINGLSAALGIFQKNMEAANDSSSKQGKTFKQLGIDTRDNEMALRQAFTALAKMGTGAQQTAKAMELFGRGGKDVLAIVKETNGSLDEAMVKFRKMGLIIGTEAAKAADDFNDALTHLELQILGITRTISQDAMPAVTAGLQTISEALKSGETDWNSWGMTIAKVILTVESAIGGLANMLSNLDWTNFLPFYGLGKAAGDFVMGATSTADKIVGKFNAARSVGAGIDLPGFMKPRLGGSSGGGGGRGGGGSAKQDPGLALQLKLEKELADLMPKRVMWEQLMGKEYASTLDKVKKKIYILDIEIAQQKKINELTRERLAISRPLRVLDPGEDTAIRDRIALVETLLQREVFLATRQRTFGGDMLKDLGGGSVVFQGGATRPRIATVEEQVAREQIAKIREQMQGLAGDLTSIFARSIGDGFNQGVKSGLQTLAQGLLQIVQDVFLKRLAEGLSGLLGGLATGGGGSWWKTLLGIAGPALAGGISLGGGSSFTPGGTGLVRPRVVGRATGGSIWPGTDYLVHKNEVITPSVPGYVIPKGQAGQAVVHNHYTINLPPAPNTSYNPRRSARQQADMILAALQGA